MDSRACDDERAYARTRCAWPHGDCNGHHGAIQVVCLEMSSNPLGRRSCQSNDLRCLILTSLFANRVHLANSAHDGSNRNSSPVGIDSHSPSSSKHAGHHTSGRARHRLRCLATLAVRLRAHVSKTWSICSGLWRAKVMNGVFLNALSEGDAELSNETLP